MTTYRLVVERGHRLVETFITTEPENAIPAAEMFCWLSGRLEMFLLEEVPA